MRKTLLLIALMLLALLSTMCAPAQTTAPTEEPAVAEEEQAAEEENQAAEEEEQVAEEVESEPKILGIATGQACPSMAIETAGGMGPCDIQINQIYEGLTSHPHDGGVEPALGTSWEMVDDTTWEFKLREGVTFHNGEEFTADDVKYSFELALNEETAWPVRSNLILIDEVEVVDDHTVRFHTSAPWPDLPWFVADAYVMPKDHTEEVGLDALIDSPVGTGPFEFVDFVPDDYLELKRYDDWWGGAVALDGVMWRQIPEPATRVAALQAGEIDIAVQVPLDLIPQVEDEPGIHMDYAAEELTLQFYLQTLPESGSPLADNPTLRKALDYAIDKEALWQGLMGGRGALSGQQLSPTVFGYNPNIEQTPYDPERAKELLAEAGYPDGLTLDMACPVGKYFVDRDVCIASEDMLEQVGVDINLEVGELATWVEHLTNPTTAADMVYVGWYSYGNPAQAMQWFSETQPWSRWHNEEYDRLFEIAKTSLDEEEREQAYWDMAEILKDEAPAVFLLQQPAPYGISDRTEGFTPHPAQKIILTETEIVE